jgi:hypothetical protein
MAKLSRRSRPTRGAREKACETHEDRAKALLIATKKEKAYPVEEPLVRGDYDQSPYGSFISYA